MMSAHAFLMYIAYVLLIHTSCNIIIHVVVRVDHPCGHPTPPYGHVYIYIYIYVLKRVQMYNNKRPDITAQGNQVSCAFYAIFTSFMATSVQCIYTCGGE